MRTIYIILRTSGGHPSTPYAEHIKRFTHVEGAFREWHDAHAAVTRARERDTHQAYEFTIEEAPLWARDDAE